MIKINPDPEFTADIQITIPGQIEPATVGLTFKYKNRTQQVEFWKWAQEKGRKDTEVISAVITDWSGFDADFSKENMATFLENHPASAREIMNAYNKLLLESRVKN